MSCGGETLQTFLDRAGRNTMYTSKKAVVEFVNALGPWLEESLLKRLHKVSFFSILADESTDLTMIEDLPICCHWVEIGWRVVSKKNTSLNFFP